MQLENKVAIVTGAGSGIGKEIALIFAKEKARIGVICQRRFQSPEVFFSSYPKSASVAS